MFFRIGVLAYNLFRLFTLTTLSPSWHRHQVQTIRWRLYQTRLPHGGQVAGKIVFHGGTGVLEGKTRFPPAFCRHSFQDMGIRYDMTDPTETYLLRASRGRGVPEVPAERVVKAWKREIWSCDLKMTSIPDH